MKKPLDLLLIVLLASSLFTQAFAEPTVDDEINQVKAAAIKAYNSKDIETIMSLWHTNGRIIGRPGPKSMVLIGADNIRPIYEEQFNSAHPNTISVDSEHSEYSNGLYFDSGTQSVYDQHGMEIVKACYLKVYKRENGSFKTWREYSFQHCLNNKR